MPAMRWAGIVAGLAVRIFGTPVLAREALVDSCDASR